MGSASLSLGLLEKRVKAAFDGDYVCESHLLKRIGGQGTPVAATAVADDGRVFVWDNLVYPHLKRTAAYMSRSIYVLSFELFLLPDIDDDGTLLRKHESIFGVNFFDAKPRLVCNTQEIIRVLRHTSRSRQTYIYLAASSGLLRPIDGLHDRPSDRLTQIRTPVTTRPVCSAVTDAYCYCGNHLFAPASTNLLPPRCPQCNAEHASLMPCVFSPLCDRQMIMARLTVSLLMRGAWIAKRKLRRAT